MNEEGRLIELTKDQAMPKGFHQIPRELEAVAQEALAGRAETVVDVYGDGPLSQYLRDRQRMAAKRKARNRAARKRGK